MKLQARGRCHVRPFAEVLACHNKTKACTTALWHNHIVSPQCWPQINRFATTTICSLDHSHPQTLKKIPFFDVDVEDDTLLLCLWHAPEEHWITSRERLDFLHEKERNRRWQPQLLSDNVQHQPLPHHSFSDDNQLYKSGHILQLQDIIQSTQCCISDLKDWMTNNKSRLNENKTDMILISARKVLNNTPLPSEICLNGTSIKLSQTVHNLGVTVDQTLSFQQHISNICCTC